MSNIEEKGVTIEAKQNETQIITVHKSFLDEGELYMLDECMEIYKQTPSTIFAKEFVKHLFVFLQNKNEYFTERKSNVMRKVFSNFPSRQSLIDYRKKGLLAGCYIEEKTNSGGFTIYYHKRKLIAKIAELSATGQIKIGRLIPVKTELPFMEVDKLPKIENLLGVEIKENDEEGYELERASGRNVWRSSLNRVLKRR
jgi:hypothetical protein